MLNRLLDPPWPERIALIGGDVHFTYLDLAKLCKGPDRLAPLYPDCTSLTVDAIRHICEVIHNDSTHTLHTTGSTGDPKPILITRACRNAALKSIIQVLGYDGTQREVIGVPLDHSYGLGHLYCTLVTGGTVHISRGLQRPKRFIDALSRATGAPMPPAMLALLMGQYRDYFVPRCHLKYIVCNTAPLPEELARDVLDTFPDLDLWVYYGLTEASRSTFHNLRETRRFDSVGKASPGVDIKIDAGEVLIRGDHVSPSCELDNGWLRTGDLGTLDKEGFLMLNGRKDDVINCGGIKYSAKAIEDELRPHVVDVVVLSEPNDVLGANPVACVVFPPAPCVYPMTSHCRIMSVSKIPRSGTGKPLMSEIRRLVE